MKKAQVYILQNTVTGQFYSDSLHLEDEADRAGKKWKNVSDSPIFGKRYTRRKDALRRSRELADQTGCPFDIVTISTAVPKP